MPQVTLETLIPEHFHGAFHLRSKGLSRRPRYLCFKAMEVRLSYLGATLWTGEKPTPIRNTGLLCEAQLQALLVDFAGPDDTSRCCYPCAMHRIINN